MPDTTTKASNTAEPIQYQFTDPETGAIARMTQDEIAALIFKVDVRPAPTNVIQALARVIEEMPNIAKDQEMNAPGQKYSYRSIEQISAYAGRLLGKYGCVIKAHKISREVGPIQKGSGAWTRDLVKVRYRIYGPAWTPGTTDPDLYAVEDWITTGWYHAIADDNSDKGINKAMTQARKQMLVDLLEIGDNKEDADSEHHDNAPPPPTVDWSELSGWTRDEAVEAGKMARARLKDLSDYGTITKEEATEWWAKYTSLPDGRTVAYREDDAGWTSAFDSFISGRNRETGQSPQSPSEPQTAQEQPATASEPPKAPEAPQVDPETWQPPADNAYRSSLDQRYRRDGLDALQKSLTAMTDERVSTGLRHRGVDEATYTHWNLAMKRRNLGLIIVRNGQNGMPEHPITGDPDEETEPEKPVERPGEDPF